MFSTEIQHFIVNKKYPNFSPKAVFFDMDGVLFDSMKYHSWAWVKAFELKGIPFTEYECYLNEGRTGASTIDGVYMQQFNRVATEEEKKSLYHSKSNLFEQSGKTEEMPFALELLLKLKSQHFQIFLVTGSGQPTLLDSLNVSFPNIFNKNNMVTAFDVTEGKPHPEPYLKALKKSGLQPWEVVVVENAPLGVESAKAAGLFVLAVNTGVLEDKILIDSGADIVFDTIKELFEKWDYFRANF